jgi:hypothetical protein
MIKIINDIFQHHNDLFSTSNKEISYNDIIEYFTSEPSSFDKNCRLVKISMIEIQKKLFKKGLLNDNFKLNTKLIKESGLENITEVLQFKDLKKKYDDLKKKLPLILCSISNEKKDTTANKITSYNNRIVIDIDDLEIQNKKAIDILNKSKNDPYCEFSFISPGGDGVKLFYYVDLQEELSDSKITDFHKYCYEYISNYVKNNYDVDIDTSTSNINRSCLLSRGFEYYHNEWASVIEVYENWNKTKKNYKKVKSVVNTNNKSNSAIDHLLSEFIAYFDSNPTDLFTDRLEWIKLSYTIVHIKGESGLSVFQKLSSYSTNYNASAANKLYKNSLNTHNPDRLGKYPERWLFKIMTDNGFIPKTTDRILKNFRWKESDYVTMIEELDYSLIEDEITGDRFIRKGKDLIKLEDTVFNQLITDLRLKYNDGLDKSKLETYILSENNIIKRNFIKEKIESFKYEKSDEFDKIFLYLDTEEDIKLVKKILFRWSLGVIKNVYENYYDEMLVLKSKQGIGKTTWIIDYLTKPFEEWVTTSFNWDNKNTDDIKLISNKMFIYDSENISMKNADSKTIKKITSMSKIDYRRPYDRFPITKKRIASFIMDTNEDFIYNDITGGRRYLIISINDMNIYDHQGGHLKKIDYEKVWGYIYSEYLKGKRPGDIDIDELNEIRDNYRLKADIENIIDDLFEPFDDYNMSFNEIKNHLNNYYLENDMKLNIDGFTDAKIGRLIGQKFDKKRKKINGVTQIMYKCGLKTFGLEKNIYNVKKEDDMIDSILDNISKRGEGPNQKEREILEKLRNKK